MATYTAQRTDASEWANIFHDSLANYGFVPAEFYVESGGALGVDGLRMTTDAINQAELEALVDAAGSLTVVALPAPTLDADGVDMVTITCDEFPAAFHYRIYKFNIEIASGEALDGSLELTAIEEARYIVEVFDSNSQQTGYVVITTTGYESEL